MTDTKTQIIKQLQNHTKFSLVAASLPSCPATLLLRFDLFISLKCNNNNSGFPEPVFQAHESPFSQNQNHLSIDIKVFGKLLIT